MSYKPIKDAKVTIRDVDLKLVTEGYTNEEGIFETRLLTGRYHIAVEKEGYQPHEQWTDVLQDIDKLVVLATVPTNVLQTITRAKFRDMITPTVTLPEVILQTLSHARFTDWKDIYALKKASLVTLSHAQFTDWRDIYTLKPKRLQTLTYGRYTDWKDIYIKHYAKLQTISKGQYTDQGTISTYTPTTEQIDPNDPTWCPPEGWTKVWKFLSEDELNDFANYIKENAYVENGVLEFSPPDGLWGCAERYVSGTHLVRCAGCIRISVSQCTANTPFFFPSNTFEGKDYLPRTTLEPSNPNKLRFTDAITGDYLTFDNPSDWFVVVFDFIEEKAKAYDKNKNLIAEFSFTYRSYTGHEYYFIIREANVEGTRFDVKVDWVAVQTA